MQPARIIRVRVFSWVNAMWYVISFVAGFAAGSVGLWFFFYALG